MIGQGSPNKAGTHDVHGAALGAAEVAATREALGWTAAPVRDARRRGRGLERRGARRRAPSAPGASASRPTARTIPLEAAEFERRMAGDLLPAFADKLPEVFEAIAAKADAVATRKASQNALDVLAPLLPEFFGGSADLTGSNLTNFKGCVRAGRDAWGNHLSYGVREFGMAAIMNGIALHGGYIPYGGTFLTFSDYSRNAIRMAALMKQRVIHVFTHDSIGLGEDGPTHQSVEHVPSLRIIPDLDVWRPADGLETAVAWACAIERRDGPSALALSRQNLPRLADGRAGRDIRRGGYVLADRTAPEAVIIATGSETLLAMEAHEQLAKEGIATRVVSMPCTNVFDRQPQAYQDAVLPLDAARGGGGSRAPGFLAQVRRAAPAVVVGIASFRRVGAGQGPVPALRHHHASVVQAVRALVHRARCRSVPLPVRIAPMNQRRCVTGLSIWSCLTWTAR